MPGLRIRHTDPQVRGCVLIVPVTRRPGQVKQVPIHVDGSGHSIVSQGVWEDLNLAARQGTDHGFTMVNGVRTPPNLTLTLGDKRPMTKPTKQIIERVVRDVLPMATRVTVRS